MNQILKYSLFISAPLIWLGSLVIFGSFLFGSENSFPLEQLCAEAFLFFTWIIVSGKTGSISQKGPVALLLGVVLAFSALIAFSETMSSVTGYGHIQVLLGGISGILAARYWFGTLLPFTSRSAPESKSEIRPIIFGILFLVVFLLSAGSLIQSILSPDYVVAKTYVLSGKTPEKTTVLAAMLLATFHPGMLYVLLRQALWSQYPITFSPGEKTGEGEWRAQNYTVDGILKELHQNKQQPDHYTLERWEFFYHMLPHKYYFAADERLAQFREANELIRIRREEFRVKYPVNNAELALYACLDCLTRATTVVIGNMEIPVCRQCLRTRKLGRAQRIIAVLGPGSVHIREREDWEIPAWEAHSNSIREMDVDLIRIEEGGDFDYNWAVSDFIEFLEQKGRNKKVEVEIHGEPPISENAIRLLKSIEAPPQTKTPRIKS